MHSHQGVNERSPEQPDPSRVPLTSAPSRPFPNGPAGYSSGSSTGSERAQVCRYAAKVAASSMPSRPKINLTGAPSNLRVVRDLGCYSRASSEMHESSSAQRDVIVIADPVELTRPTAKPRRSPRCPVWRPAPFSKAQTSWLAEAVSPCLVRQFHRGNWKRCAAPAADYVPATIWHLEILLRHRVGNPSIYAHSMSRPRSRQWTRTLSSSP